MNAEASQPSYSAGEGTQIDAAAIIGYGVTGRENRTTLGRNCRIRAGSILYHSVRAGDFFQTGHNALVRENTAIGNHVLVGTNSIIDGNVTIGDFVKIESGCYIPTHVTIGTRVFLGPAVTLTNDRYPLRMRDSYRPEGQIIEDDVSIGGGVTVTPGIRIGEGSFVAAGAIVTKDVPPKSLVIGMGEIQPLPDKLRERNMALSWRKYIE